MHSMHNFIKFVMITKRVIECYVLIHVQYVKQWLVVITITEFIKMQYQLRSAYLAAFVMKFYILSISTDITDLNLSFGMRCYMIIRC